MCATDLFVTLSMLFVITLPTSAQRPGRRVVTLDLLVEHPLFFHGQDVIVRSDTVGETVLTYLVDEEVRLLVLDVPPPPSGITERLEVIGTFYDVGRLEPRDPRAIGQPFERLAESLLGKPWPGTGELMLVVASSSRPAAEPAAATLRTIALNPKTHRDQGVTITGRFRGRNLYGDLPDSPGESRYDFVLTSADAAVWVVGKEPRGDDFKLDVQARRDTGRWLQVTGQVRVHEGMVVIDADTIRLVEPREDQVAVVATEPQPQGPAPDVIFSTPLEGDTDVPTDTTVRIQFSRDMDPESFVGRVRVGYARPRGGTDDRPLIGFDAQYRGLNRVLEIRFEQPLDLFLEVSVQLLDGIAASDGTALEPWSLSFSARP